MPRKGYLQIKVSESEHETLRRLAAESRVSVSDWIRGAIRAKTASQIGGKLSFSPDSELEAIRRELQAPDFEYLQLLFVPGDPVRSLELWCRTKAELTSKRREWYLKHAERIVGLRNLTQTSSKLPVDIRSGPV